jgi:hypothetical protein
LHASIFDLRDKDQLQTAGGLCNQLPWLFLLSFQQSVNATELTTVTLPHIQDLITTFSEVVFSHDLSNITNGMVTHNLIIAQARRPNTSGLLVRQS